MLVVALGSVSQDGCLNDQGVFWVSSEWPWLLISLWALLSASSPVKAGTVKVYKSSCRELQRATEGPPALTVKDLESMKHGSLCRLASLPLHRNTVTGFSSH